MLCKAVNKWRGVEFIPPVALLDNPAVTLQSCLIAYASELHTGQIEIVADKEFMAEAEDKMKDDPLLVKRDPPVQITPDTAITHSYDGVPILVTG